MVRQWNFTGQTLKLQCTFSPQRLPQIFQYIQMATPGKYQSLLKSNVWRSKLQYFSETSKVCFIIYSDHTPHVEEIVKNIPKVIEQEKFHKTNIVIQSKAAFDTEEERKFSIKYNNHCKDQHTAHNHRKFPIIYTAHPCSTTFL